MWIFMVWIGITDLCMIGDNGVLQVFFLIIFMLAAVDVFEIVLLGNVSITLMVIYWHAFIIAFC